MSLVKTKRPVWNWEMFFQNKVCLHVDLLVTQYHIIYPKNAELTMNTNIYKQTNFGTKQKYIRQDNFHRNSTIFRFNLRKLNFNFRK